MKRLVRAIAHPYRTAGRILAIVEQFWPQSKSKIAADAANFWNSSDNSSRVRDLSHWLGEGRWSDEGAWTYIGQLHFAMFEKLCLLADVARPANSMIEWGPGGGANAIQFCSEVTDFYGIDISAANLAECQRQLEMCGFGGFLPILIDGDTPEQCLELVKSPVDVFLSTAVYQHFPSKEYGVRVTELAHKLLADNGVALIQIRYNDGSERFRPKYRDYHKNVVTFTSYGIVEFWQIVLQVGFSPLAITLGPSVNYAYFFLKKGEANA